MSLLVRNEIAKKYIKGKGVEIGANHCPLEVNAEVTYVDIMPDERRPTVISDGETLHQFAFDSLDFIIANHVLEHCHDPIGALSYWSMKLKDGGIAFIALPDKEQTFDQPRFVTPLIHLIADFESDDTRSGDTLHYADWHYHIDGLRGQALEDRVKLDLDSNANIHFHVFDFNLMERMFEYMKDCFKILESKRNGCEVIWILEAK